MTTAIWTGYDDAKQLRDQRWRLRHAPRIPDAADDV